MKTILSILIISLVLSSCKKDEPKLSNVIDGNLGITLQDKAGNDLFNPANPGAYLAKDVKVFYLTNGVKEEVYYANQTYPRNFYFDTDPEPDGKYWMTLFLNLAQPDGAYAITYIQWNENDTDTLKTQVAGDEGFVVAGDLWFNDSLIWRYEDYMIGARNIHIIK
jgi:hypothetical protein